MADGWRQIPGNEHAFERLRDAIACGEAIAFVGAGASAGLYPLWTGLIRRLADETVKQGMAVAADRDFWLAPATKAQQAVRGIKRRWAKAHMRKPCGRSSGRAPGRTATTSHRCTAR